jgi:hypothetical protein
MERNSGVRSWMEEAMVGSMGARARVGRVRVLYRVRERCLCRRGRGCGYVGGCGIAARCSLKAVRMSSNALY